MAAPSAGRSGFLALAAIARRDAAVAVVPIGLMLRGAANGPIRRPPIDGVPAARRMVQEGEIAELAFYYTQ